MAKTKLIYAGMDWDLVVCPHCGTREKVFLNDKKKPQRADYWFLIESENILYCRCCTARFEVDFSPAVDFEHGN